MLRAVGEPFVSRFRRDEAREILSNHGFIVTTDESDPEWSERYLGTRTDFAIERLVSASRS